MVSDSLVEAAADSVLPLLDRAFIDGLVEMRNRVGMARFKSCTCGWARAKRPGVTPCSACLVWEAIREVPEVLEEEEQARRDHEGRMGAYRELIAREDAEEVSTISDVLDFIEREGGL